MLTRKQSIKSFIWYAKVLCRLGSECENIVLCFHFRPSLIEWLQELTVAEEAHCISPGFEQFDVRAYTSTMTNIWLTKYFSLYSKGEVT